MGKMLNRVLVNDTHKELGRFHKEQDTYFVLFLMDLTEEMVSLRSGCLDLTPTVNLKTSPSEQ